MEIIMKTIFVNRTPNEISECESHSHSCWELILQLSGMAVVEMNDEKFEVNPGTVTIVPPNTAHYESSDGLFNDMYIQAEELPFSNMPFTVFDHNGNVTQLFHILHKSYIEKEERNISDTLLAAICEYITVLNNENYKYAFIRDFKNNMMMNISNAEYNIKESAVKSGFSYSYLKSCFKKDVGETPLEFLTNIRINHAKKLLLQTPFYSISEVAYLCGFNDPLYFSRCFRKHTGVSPREYKTAE